LLPKKRSKETTLYNLLVSFAMPQKKERKEFSFLPFFNGKTTAQINKGGMCRAEFCEASLEISPLRIRFGRNDNLSSCASWLKTLRNSAFSVVENW